jgi:hypothetical protein
VSGWRRSKSGAHLAIGSEAMTLVLSVHSRNCLWVVVDRRLSYGRHRTPKDDAVKIMRLETADGVGLLAYGVLVPRRRVRIRPSG